MENFLLVGIIGFPIVGVVFYLFLTLFFKEGANRLGQMIAVASSALSFFLSVAAFMKLQSQETTEIFYKVEWIREFSVNFSLQMDGLSSVFCLLLSTLFPVCVGSQWNKKEATGSMGLLLVLQTSLLGTILSEDLFFQCFFWTLSAIPIYFLAAVFGGARAKTPSFFGLVFSSLGNILFFLAVMLIYQGVDTPTFSIQELTRQVIEGIHLDVFGKNANLGTILMALFGTGLLLRSPLWPFSGWYLPLVQSAPISVLVTLVGAVFPTCCYLLIRLGYSLFPQTLEASALILAIFGGINVVVGALGALNSRGVRRVTAYSGVSVLGFSLVGMSVPKGGSIVGLVLQIIAMGASLALVALLSECFAERNGDDSFRSSEWKKIRGGLSKVTPWLAVFSGFAFLSCLSMPGTMGFVGNSLLILGSYSERPWAAFLGAGWFVLFSFIYFRIFRDLFLGEYKQRTEVKDLSGWDRLLYFPLVIMVLFLGVYPKPTVTMMKNAVEHLMKRST